MDKQTNIASKIYKYKGVIFDLDGTLVDLGVNWQELKNTLEAYCYSKKRINIEFTPIDQKILYTKKQFGKKFFLELINIVADAETQGIKYQPNLELINYINSATKQKIAIYSMNTKKCIDGVIKMYFQRRPDIIVSKETCIEPKPTNKDIQFILDQFKLKNTEVIFIGNSKYDLLSGKKANVFTHIIDNFNKNFNG